MNKLSGVKVRLPLESLLKFVQVYIMFNFAFYSFFAYQDKGQKKLPQTSHPNYPYPIFLLGRLIPLLVNA